MANIISDISYLRFAHADTNILSELAKDKNLWRPLQDFLHSNDICLAISGAQAGELSEARQLHVRLNLLLTSVPSALIKTADQVLDAEVGSHPTMWTGNIFVYPINAMFGTSKLLDFLGSNDLLEARKSQRTTANLWMERLRDLKPNFPPAEHGKYTRHQADLFVWSLIVQELKISHPQFTLGFLDKVQKLQVRTFQSLQVMGYAIFYKYYLGGRTPKPSDFGDMFHLYDIPYCRLAILERDLCQVLNQVKKNHKVLQRTTILNKDFLSDWNWVEQ